MTGPDPEVDKDQESLREQSFLSHVLELKNRVTQMMIGIIIPFIVFAC